MKFFAKIRAHPVAVTIIIAASAVLAAVYWYGTRPRNTLFVIGGDTTSLTFHSKEQHESQDQAGIFASSDRTVDMVVSCSSLREIGSETKALTCRYGTAFLQHVSVNSVRLNGATRVKLTVTGNDLSMTLTQLSGGRPVVTLFSDGQTKVGQGSSLATGEWTVDVSGPAVNLTFLNPRFDPSEDEGGEKLVEGSSLEFEHKKQSGFVGNTGKLILAMAHGKVREISLRDSRLQVLGVTNGEIRSLVPVVSPEGKLQSLRIRVAGSSETLDLTNTVESKPENRALSFDDYHTVGVHQAIKAISYIFGSLAAIATCYELLLRFLEHVRAKQSDKVDSQGYPSEDPRKEIKNEL